MMTKILTADKDCSPEIALAWSVHAANVLESRFGVSPSMLVFGKNISAHPELSPHAPATLETQINISEKIRSHLDAISKAREAFVQAESDQTIADALKARIYHKYEELEIGQWIYWRNHESNKFQGPEKIVMLDNKKVFAIRNNKLISINRDHVILKRSEFENTQPLITLPPLPEENTHENSKVSDNDTDELVFNNSDQNVEKSSHEDNGVVEFFDIVKNKTVQTISNQDTVPLQTREENVIMDDHAQFNTVSSREPENTVINSPASPSKNTVINPPAPLPDNTVTNSPAPRPDNTVIDSLVSPHDQRELNLPTDEPS